MRCYVPFCENTSDNVSTSEAEGKGISFHAFPSDAHLRAVWLRALGKQDSHLPDSAVVCSQHFLNDDIYETESGSKQIGTDAVPSTVQVCMICLDTDSKLFLMSKHKLEEAYEKLTRHPPHDQGNLKQTVCIQCAQKLINFNKFRDKSLRARALIMDLVEKHELITQQHIKMINRTKHQLKSSMVLTMLGPDHCDLHILEYSSEDKQTEFKETHHSVGVVKTEGSDDSMSVDGDMEVVHEDDNNINDNDFVQDLLKYESITFQCTICLKEFVHEQAHMQHMNMHLQNSDGDDVCDTSQVCKPHTAVRQADPIPSARTAQTSVAPLSTSLAIKNEIEVPPTEETDTNISCRYKILHCFVKLYDVMKVLPRQGGSLMKAQNAVRSSVTDTDTVKVILSKSLQSKIDCLNNIVTLRCNNSTQSSTQSEKISFICDICRKMFKRKSLLVKHMKTHSIIKRFSCALCEYKCIKNSLLIMHMRTHTGEKPFSCKICEYKCADKSNLLKHMRTHSGEKPFICKICNYQFAQNSKLVMHMRTHTGENSYYCKICNHKFAHNSNLKLHMRTHSIIKHFSCAICEYKSTRKYGLIMHMRTHTGEKPYSCKKCKYKCANKSNLVKHMRTHTGEKPFICNKCDTKFACYSELLRHIKTHTSEKPYLCKICDKKFASNSELVRHMKTHTGDKPYCCKLCQYKCVDKSKLDRHMKTHTGEKPYCCKICGSKFADNGNLALHMRTHTGEKPYCCKICNSKFAQNVHLVRHMRTHTGEKPYSCQLCDSKFASNTELVRHMRTHTGEKPYSCKICKYKCVDKSKLDRHMKTHTGEKPYCCKMCGSQFAVNSNLVSHMKTHTGEEPYCCKICNRKFAQNIHLVRHMRTHTDE